MLLGWCCACGDDFPYVLWAGRYFASGVFVSGWTGLGEPAQGVPGVCFVELATQWCQVWGK